MTDWIYIGSNGFAQVGDPLYRDKDLAERRIIFQILEENKELHIPDEFYGIAEFSWRGQQHDFGIYHDLNIKYRYMVVARWEEDDPEKFDRFYDWINELESFDFETPEITERCEKKYFEMFPDRACKVVHLNQKVA